MSERFGVNRGGAKGNLILHSILCVVQDDVSLMKELKLNHYRFSISWPRLIPTGIKCEYLLLIQAFWNGTDMYNLIC